MTTGSLKSTFSKNTSMEAMVSTVDHLVFRPPPPSVGSLLVYLIFLGEGN